MSKAPWHWNTQHKTKNPKHTSQNLEHKTQNPKHTKTQNLEQNLEYKTQKHRTQNLEHSLSRLAS